MRSGSGPGEITDSSSNAVARNEAARNADDGNFSDSDFIAESYRADDDYLAASAFIRAETDPQGDDFFTISRDDVPLEAEVRAQLVPLKRSFTGANTLFCQRPYTDDAFEYLNDYLATAFDERGVDLHLGALYGPSFGGLRPLLPTIQYDPTHSPKNWVPRAQGGVSEFPDTTFNGVLLPLGAAYDCDGDGIPDDGNGSGVAGDAPCIGGNQSGCDGNAPHSPNGPARGTCIAGDTAPPDATCGVDADCGSGGQCSLAQADADSDGVGDPIDNCSLASNPDQRDDDYCTIASAEGSFDEFEPGVGIEQWGGPLDGKSLEFACGPCADNDFSQSADSIGGGDSLCGYYDRVPRSIIDNRDTVCARNIYSGRTWEIQLLSHRKWDGDCYDADGGESCANAGGETSYVRSAGDGLGDVCDADADVPVTMPSLAIACPEPTAALLQLAALLSLAGIGRLRRSARPGAPAGPR